MQAPRQMGGQQQGGMGAPRQMGGQPGGGGGGGGQAGQMMDMMYRPQGPQRPTYGLGDAPEWSQNMWTMQSRCQGGDGKACQQLQAMKQGLQQQQQQYGQDYSFAQQNAIGQAPRGGNGGMRQR